MYKYPEDVSLKEIISFAHYFLLWMLSNPLRSVIFIYVKTELHSQDYLTLLLIISLII